MYVIYNPNPFGSRRGDCVIRAISKAMGKKWIEIYMDLCLEGLMMGDMPSSNAVWGRYLIRNGFTRKSIPNSCPDCMTVKEFLKSNNLGTFVLGTGSHAVCGINGNYFDSWDSGDEIPIYYYQKGDGK